MKNYLPVVVLLLLMSLGILGFYIYTNLQQNSNTTVVDQTGLDDDALISAIKAQTADDGSGETVAIDQDSSSISRIKSGSFARFDPAHYANGSAVIYETEDGPILKLEGFETPNGPDLFVYLATNSEIYGIKANRGEDLSLGKLKSITGDQVYKLPENYDDYGSVVIWCRAFDINFSAAPLN